MYKLLEDYLNEVEYQSEPKVESFHTEDSKVYYTFRYTWNCERCSKSDSIELTDLLVFVYSKITTV